MTPKAPAIAMQNVDLSLGSGAARVHILRGVTLEVAEGVAVGLVGPSGSGKIHPAHGRRRAGAAQFRFGAGRGGRN